MNAGIPVLLPLFAAFTLTFGAIWFLIRGNFLKVLDHPNSRSLHAQAVPRTGGLGLLSGILVSWTLIPAALPSTVWISIVLLAAVSFGDDIFGFPVAARLLIHGTMAAWFAAAALSDTHGWPVAIVVALAITWMLNLYNFMDGSDGLAGGMTLIGFSCYGMTAWGMGNEPFAIVNFCVAAAAAAFLLFNFYPARIFMGDVGAVPLGFLAAVSGVIGWVNGNWPIWLPLLVFSPFIADASVTLMKRGLRGERVWQAHREHYYQRLVRSGMGHRNTALLGYIVMVAAGASAIWAMSQRPALQLGVGFAWIGFYLIMMWLCDHRWARRTGDS